MPRRGKKNVGIIGLGIIGSRVADNLRLKGFHVFVWNRSPRPVPNFVGAPAELAEMCDSIQIFVSDDEALFDVVKQLAPVLAPRHIVMVHSTVAPHSMRAAADVVEKRGARFVEAPFTGSKLSAEKGELVYYVAGDEIALREARPVLEASSTEIIEIGAIGQATVIKIATNILTASMVQAAAEALALTRDSGIALEKFAAAMKSNASNSGTLSMKLPKMIEGKFDPHFSVKHMLKDMQIASRLGLLNHLELTVTTATRDRLLELAQRGFGDEDYSAVARKYFHEGRSTPEEANLELFEHATEEPAPLTEVAASFGNEMNSESAIPEAQASKQEAISSQPSPSAVVEMAKPNNVLEGAAIANDAPKQHPHLPNEINTESSEAEEPSAMEDG